MPFIISRWRTNSSSPPKIKEQFKQILLYFMRKKYNYEKHKKKNTALYEAAINVLKDNDHAKSKVVNGIKLIGSYRFMQNLEKAIYLLKENDEINFMRVCRYIKEIVMLEHFGGGQLLTTLNVYLESGREVIKYNDSWIPSCIVHEAIHGIIYDKLSKRGFPKDRYREERACVRVQVRCLKRLGDFIPDEKAYIERIMSTRWFTKWNTIVRLFKI